MEIEVKETCVGCGKPTPYDKNIPVTARHFYIDGSGQLYSDCWNKLWPSVTDLSDGNENKKGKEMQFLWFNKDGRKRTVSLSSIDDIEQYEEDGLFCLQLKNAFVGGRFAAFKEANSREKACTDIKEAIEAGDEEFEFHPSVYER